MIRRKKCVLLTFFMNFFLATICFADFKVKDHYLLIGVDVPPAIVDVMDQQGNITGVDFNVPLNQFGMGKKILQIPNSYVDEQNITDDESGNDEPQMTTGWSISIKDQPAGSYKVILKGLQTGISTVDVFGNVRPNYSDIPRQELEVLISSGVTRQLQVAFDPVAKTLAVQRIVNPGDLEADVNTACQLNLISPLGICQSLKAKADSIMKDAQKGDFQSEIQHVQVFLQELKVTDKNHIREPAFTILQDEAQTLLNGLNNQQPQASVQPEPYPNWLKKFWNELTKIFG